MTGTVKLMKRDALMHFGWMPHKSRKGNDTNLHFKHLKSDLLSINPAKT